MKIKYPYVLLLSMALLLASCSSFVAIERAGISSSGTAFKNYLQAENIEIVSGNSVELLNGAHAKFEDMFSAIKEAKHHIHLEYFNFRNDSINAVLIALLSRQAEQ